MKMLTLVDLLRSFECSVKAFDPIVQICCLLEVDDANDRRWSSMKSTGGGDDSLVLNSIDGMEYDALRAASCCLRCSRRLSTLSVGWLLRYLLALL